MTEKNNLPEENQDNQENYNGLNLYIAIASTVLAAIFFGATFTPLGVYSLIVATLFSLVGLSFISKHKKYKNDGVCKAVSVVTYVVFALCLLFFVGGMIAAGLQS